ncbi:catalase [Methanosarcina sp. 2.H.T.1A.6]|uniref:catalase n=1 Tax=unclassified Methanosarcina TaxID=2644672 RepID=UPI0006225563|nr:MULTISPECIES: catalase [unclassified Methanosarcina]KKG16073.1 catalase [Methanosarcina sp. 2.H.T.1A.3]KKG20916.1 catalase [Methanosarcina sp. 2.H.T.1A.8]KKG24307.1 catalase [Methanosarcina sp. 2.H.T.1A.6]KKG27972.1 catalase [Methanosarcina sp. 2.H.T.1A.15]
MSEKKPSKVLTTGFGIPVGDDQNSLTAGERGPVLMQDVHLLDKLSHFDRERIPERVVHAKGAGAGGYFEVTADVTKYTKAKFLSEVGKRTEVFVRFSTVGGEKGSADAARDPRGFAIKFYTEDGNHDLTGNNTPVFFIRDPLKFPDFIHTQKRNPATNCKDPDMFWDFLSLTPESIHQVTILFSDRGTPATFRNMNGYSSHTYKWYNDKGEYFWVQYHFKTDQGIKNLNREEAEKLSGTDPDHATRDLYAAIERGDYPSWTLEMQIMTPEQAKDYRFDILDITKVWPHGDFPPIKIGKLVLNRNPTNYFAEVEQAAFSPANLVPGIGISPDKMLQARVFSYHDTHIHRLGPNYNLIPVNAPKYSQEVNYQRDGFMRVDGNQGGGPNYWPNSFGGPAPDPAFLEPPFEVSGPAARTPYNYPNDDFVQPGNLYRNVMTEEDREHLVGNIVSHLSGAQKRIQLRQTALFFKADPGYGSRVAKGLGLDIKEVERLANMTKEERAKATEK